MYDFRALLSFKERNTARKAKARVSSRALAATVAGAYQATFEELKDGDDLIGHWMEPRAMRSTAYHENRTRSWHPALCAELFDNRILGAGSFPGDGSEPAQ